MPRHGVLFILPAGKSFDDYLEDIKELHKKFGEEHTFLVGNVVLSDLMKLAIEPSTTTVH